MNRLAMYRGMVVREGTIDDNIVRQVWDDYGLLKFNGKRVLDGGAHIGAFTHMALLRGASEIIAFEPEAENAKLFMMNEKQHHITFFESALSIKNSRSMYHRDSHLYTYSGENRGMHTLLEGAMEVRGVLDAGIQKVNETSLESVIGAYQPHIIKLDIEGSETEMFPTLLSDENIASQMAIEFHAFNDEMRSANIEFVSELALRRWEDIKTPAVNAGHQSTVGIFRR